MARGFPGAEAADMSKFFDTNYRKGGAALVGSWAAQHCFMACGMDACLCQHGSGGAGATAAACNSLGARVPLLSSLTGSSHLISH